MDNGPQPMTHSERWELALQIGAQLQQHYQNQLIALGVYGSLARGTDGPYSDIEMHCILRGEGIEQCFEWSSGPWKAEVDVVSPDLILAEAARVDGDWSITHGAFTRIKPLSDPQAFFPRLREVVLAQPDSVFKNRMEEVMVGDLYEMVGKIRNASLSNEPASMPVYAVQLAIFAACLQGLSHRCLFTSAGSMFAEALALPDPPQGFQQVCQVVVSGRLDDPAQIYQLANCYWCGVETWAARKGLELETSLQALLDQSESG